MLCVLLWLWWSTLTNQVQDARGGAAAPVHRRLAWVDLARAISIILVVFYHTGTSAVYDLLPRDISSTSEYWRTANILLVPLRMPLFFVIAGMLAAGAVRRPWASVLRPRVVDLLWAYLLWSVFFALTAWVRYAPEDPWGYILTGFENIFLVASPYWFIAVLPVFFLVTRWGRDHPRILLVLLFGAYLLSPFIEVWIKSVGPDFAMAALGVRRLTEFGVWFAGGYAVSDRLKRFGGKKRPVLALTAMTISVPFIYLAVIADLGPGVRRLMQLMATTTSVTGVLAITTLAGSIPIIAKLGEHIGSRTLVIYLVHPVVLNVVVVASRGAYERGWVSASLMADIFLVPVVVLLAVLVALGVKWLVDRIGACWLFEAPRGREKSNTGQARRRSS